MPAPDNPLAGPPGAGGPLRHLFTELIAFTLLFRETCGERAWAPAELRDRLTALIEAQERRARAGEAPWDSYVEARFAVLSWVDEAIMNSSWANRGDWQHLMLKYYGTLNAGKQFFERLEQPPARERDVLEMYYFALALGFEGKFALPENPKTLRELKQRLYNQLVSASGGVLSSEARIFPEAYRRPPAPPPPPGRSWFGFWIGLIAVTPVILFVVYLLLLQSAADARIKLLAQPTPPPVAAPTPVWNLTLVEELRRRGIDARDTPRGVVITLPGVSSATSRPPSCAWLPSARWRSRDTRAGRRVRSTSRISVYRTIGPGGWPRSCSRPVCAGTALPSGALARAPRWPRTRPRRGAASTGGWK